MSDRFDSQNKGFVVVDFVRIKHFHTYKTKSKNEKLPKSTQTESSIQKFSDRLYLSHGVFVINFKT